MRGGTSAALATIAVTAAAIAGARNGPQRPVAAVWYGALNKPSYTPPGPIVGSAWTVLEVLLGVVGYRLLRAPDTASRRVALSAWCASLAGLAAYPFLFFRQRRLAASTAVAAGMLASAAVLTGAAAQNDKRTATLATPLLAWLGFATMLSVALARRNPRLSRD